MDVICESCGTLNRSAGEFCTECGAFLAWNQGPDEQSSDDPAGGPTTSTGPDAPRQAPRDQTVDATTAGAERASRTRGDGPASTPSTATSTTTTSTAGAGNDHTATAVLPRTPAGPACPDCGRSNDPARRFCAKCGRQLVATRPQQTGAAENPAESRRRERANRRAFRSSLPAVYRWRRVGLIMLVVAVVLAGAVTVGADPISWGKARWYDLKGTVVAVPGVQATVLQTGRDAAGKPVDAALLVDGTTADWHTRWAASAPATRCEGDQTTPTIELTMAQPVRIRGVDIYPGLGSDQPQRPLQFRPQVIGITPVGAGTCQAFRLADTGDRQRLEFDSHQRVSVIRISLNSAYPAPADGEKQISIREITLLSRPQ
jgi:hypothetical protein